MTTRPAVVLLSGGLDSATTLAMAKFAGFTPYALSFRYGQRHAYELQAAAKVAEAQGVEHVVVDIDLRVFGGSALTSDVAVPKHDSAADLDADPATYVPARNTIFLSFALSYAETIGARDIFIGANSLDHPGYPDCRPEYLHAFEAMGRLATRVGNDLTVHAPLLRLSKAEIIRRGRQLGVDYGLTSSCYDPADDGHPCGHCDACLLRLEGFAQIGVPDPLHYQGA